MNTNPKYELYHPKWYRRQYPIFWWLQRPAYVKFIIREMTSLAVGYTAVLLILQVWVLSRGDQAYERFLEFLQAPAVLVFHGLALLFLLFHSVTWLLAAPKALVLRVGGKRLPDVAVLVGHYVAWLFTTALVFWLLVGS